MDYTITDILKADIQSRYLFFKNQPQLYLLNILIVFALGFPICNWGIGFLYTVLHVDLVLSILISVIGYWLSSIFWGWRIIRFFTKK